MTWQLVTAFNGVVAAAYLGISGIVLSGLVRTGQLRSNRLGVATGLIFLTCAVHHGAHSLHMLAPSLGIEDAAALSMREAWHWPNVAWDLFAAVVAVFYLSLRGHYAGMLASVSMFEDLRARERQALEINDNVVQGLTRIKWALESARHDAAAEAADTTLAQAQKMVTDLLEAGADGGAVEPGRLRRQAAASPAASG